MREAYFVMDVYNPKQLAAAIKAVPHDEPAQVILHREGKPPLVYNFDYDNRWPAGLRRRPARQYFSTEAAINLRLANIAKAILRLPKELFQ